MCCKCKHQHTVKNRLTYCQADAEKLRLDGPTQPTPLLTFYVSCRRSSWPSMVKSRARTQRPRGPAVVVASREADRVIVLQRCEGLHASDLGPGKLVWKCSTVTALVDLTGAANWRHSCSCKQQSSSACCVVTNSQRWSHRSDLSCLMPGHALTCQQTSCCQETTRLGPGWIKHQVIEESSLDFVKFVGSSSSTLTGGRRLDLPSKPVAQHTVHPYVHCVYVCAKQLHLLVHVV